MNWHERYAQQAGWTRELRHYILQRCGWNRAARVLEVGCGTGAVLHDVPDAGAAMHGLDVSLPNLRECRVHTPHAALVCGDARALPYPSATFNITFCHFLLLWIPDPVHALLEMKRVTAPSGFVICFAEPDYGARQDQPEELAWLGQRQNEALASQGAALRRGLELAELFQLAGIPITETGRIRPRTGQSVSQEEWDKEWEVLRLDLAGIVSTEDLARVRDADRQARLLGRRLLNVPTYFAWGQV